MTVRSPYRLSLSNAQVDAAQMAAIIKRTFVSQVFTTGQKAAVEYCGKNGSNERYMGVHSEHSSSSTRAGGGREREGCF